MNSVHPGMLNLGHVAQTMGRNAEGVDCALLNKVAVGCICITAMAGAAQVFISLRDQLNRQEDRKSGHGWSR